MKSKVNERKSMGRIQLGDVYNDDGQHFKVITFRDPDEPHPVGVLLDTGVIMFYNEQTFGDFQLIERDGQEVIEASNWVECCYGELYELLAHHGDTYFVLNLGTMEYDYLHESSFVYYNP